MTDGRARTPGVGLLAGGVDSKRVTGAITTGGFRLGALAARMMPGPVAAGLATPIGAGASFASPERRAIIERHLRRVDPTLRGLRLRRAVQEAFDSYARYYIESFRLPTMSSREVAASFREDGYALITDALTGGVGCILALPHLGGWEWAARWIVDRGHDLTVVVERIEPPELFDWFVDLRTRLGMNVVPLGPDVGSRVLTALSKNHVVCLLADRDLPGTGVPVDFFGERTTLPAGPATLGLRTGAPVLPTAVYFTDRVNGHLGLVRPGLDLERHSKGLRSNVHRVTQDLARELEVLIRKAPSQWHLFQPNWPSDPGFSASRSTPIEELPTT
jgi:KDO2-lipid IV(A) lauroyltransferase